MSLIEAIRNSAVRNPAKTAIAYGEESWTYFEFESITDNIALNLLGAGARPGDRVALHFLNGPELTLGYIGCLKAGCTLVPINTRLKGREIDYILRHSGSAFYIGQPELYCEITGTCPAVSELYARYLSAGDSSAGTRSFHDLLRGPVHNSGLPEIVPDHVAAILYTSGTTARPKGVVHSHETLMHTGRVMRHMRLDEDQIVLVMSSMAHLIGFGMLFLSALLNGATTVITQPFDFPSSLDAFARWNCTYTAGLPVMFKLLLDTQLAFPRNVSSGRFFFCGGDSVSPALQQAFQHAFAPVCEVYGTTEIAPAAWNRLGDERPGSFGKPGTGIAFRLAGARRCEGESGREVESGEVGELCIQGPHLMKGYWQDPDATAAAFDGGWFHTGDLARRDADGFYWFAGRRKEIIIRGGSNISPQEVEATLSEHPAVAEAGVVGRPPPAWGETVVAHVVLLPGQMLDGSDLIAFARGRLADYKVPEMVVFESELPKGATGKLQRRALREAQRATASDGSAL